MRRDSIVAALFLAFFALLFVLAWTAIEREHQKEEACMERGGVPITTRTETLCVKGIEKI